METGLKLSISNIAWTTSDDETVYGWMHELGFFGLEIAPTRIFPEVPYDHAAEARNWARRLYEMHGFLISSMQSIWYGRKEKVFGTSAEREVLTEYTKRAIDFAQAIDCANLVFGSPVNRQVPEGMSQDEAMDKAISFFKPLGAYARACGTHLSMEANPPMYNTNFINDTQAALELTRAVDDAGFTLNLDVGTMVANEEQGFVFFENRLISRNDSKSDAVQVLTKGPNRGQIREIHDNNQSSITPKQTMVDDMDHKISLMSGLNHVHISEPGLKPIEHRALHGELLRYLQDSGYNRFVSIEIGNQNDLTPVREAMEYLRATIEEI